MKIKRYFLIPFIIYLLSFLILTYPLINSFSTHFFADTHDGLQNVWNIWWVNKAVTGLHTNPWYTTYLYHPYGITLLGQTLNPINGFMAIPLLKFLSLVQTYNLLLIFSFVATGLTCFWLAIYITKAYMPSILAGYIFTFSNFHFAHGQGHLQLVTAEFLPLFILLWLIFLKKPDIKNGALSAIILFLVLLSDYYYFLYALAIAFLFTLVSIKTFKRKNIKGFVSFLLAFLLTSGLLLYSFISQSVKDPFMGAHTPSLNSQDLLSFFIPASSSRFAPLTQNFWQKISGEVGETNAFLGISAILIIFYLFLKRKKAKKYHVNLWFIIFLLFSVLSLGPVLHIFGKNTSVPLPYALLEFTFPIMRLSGVPARMAVISILSIAILSAISLKILTQKPYYKTVIVVFTALLIFEYLPGSLPATKISVPDYVYKLKELPGFGGVVDISQENPEVGITLYNQTIHEKPIVSGYVSRIPTSVFPKYALVRQSVWDKDFEKLCSKFQVQYVVVNKKDEIGILKSIDPIYSDSKYSIYDLTFLKGCSATAFNQKSSRHPQTR